MSTRIRLQRHGKKGKPFFHIVIADSRAKRDGRFIEKIGIYNPNTNPATIDLDFERALHWVGTGAQPSDTMRAMLSYKGVLYRNHLNRGVIKGALTQAQADAKYDKWLSEKEGKVQAKVDTLGKAQDEADKLRLAEETKIREARAQEILAKQSELSGEATEEAAPEVAEEAAPEAKEEVAPEVKEEAAPEAKEKATPEAKEEVAPEAKEKATPEAKEEATPEVKEEATPEVKEEATPEAKEEATPEAKEEAAPEAKEEATPEAKEEAAPKADDKKEA